MSAYASLCVCTRTYIYVKVDRSEVKTDTMALYSVIGDKNG